MRKLIISSLFIFYYLQTAVAFAKPCLYGHITILTEDGRKPSRKDIPISILDGHGVKNIKGTKNTNKDGFFCIDHSIDAGKEVALNIGESTADNNEGSDTWSGWKILSPYNGQINIPDKSNHLPLEVIIVPSSFYQTLLLDSPPEAVLGKNCQNIYKFPYVQLMSFKSRAEADREMHKLIFNGFQSCVSSKYIKNKKWHRVLVSTGSLTTIQICRDLKVNYGYKECIMNNI